MGFADYSIAEIAEDYKLSLESVFQLCDRLALISVEFLEGYQIRFDFG